MLEAMAAESARIVYNKTFGLDLLNWSIMVAGPSKQNSLLAALKICRLILQIKDLTIPLSEADNTTSGKHESYRHLEHHFDGPPQRNASTNASILSY